jgi:HD-like signal output (HDOD) protein
MAVPAGSVMAVVERTHEAAGRSVARRWALPSPVAACIADHHTPPEDAPMLVRLTVAADELAELCGSGWRVSGPAGTPTLEKLLGNRLAELATTFDGQLRAA